MPAWSGCQDLMVMHPSILALFRYGPLDCPLPCMKNGTLLSHNIAWAIFCSPNHFVIMFEFLFHGFQTWKLNRIQLKAYIGAKEQFSIIVLLNLNLFSIVKDQFYPENRGWWYTLALPGAEHSASLKNWTASLGSWEHWYMSNLRQS